MTGLNGSEVENLQQKEKDLKNTLSNLNLKMKSNKEKHRGLYEKYKIIKTKISMEDLKNTNKDILYIYNYVKYKDSSSDNLLCYLRKNGFSNAQLAFSNLDDTILSKDDLDIVQKTINNTDEFISNSVDITCEPKVSNGLDFIIYPKSSKERILRKNPLTGNKASYVDFGKTSNGVKYLKIPRGSFVKILNIVQIGSKKWAEVETTFNKKERSGWIETYKLRKVCKF